MNIKLKKEGQPLQLKGPLTKKQVAELLGVSLYLFNKWLNTVAAEIGQPKGKKYNLKQIRTLVEKFGSSREFDTPVFGSVLQATTKSYHGTLELKAGLLGLLNNHPDISLGNYIR